MALISSPLTTSSRRHILLFCIAVLFVVSLFSLPSISSQNIPWQAPGRASSKPEFQPIDDAKPAHQDVIPTPTAGVCDGFPDTKDILVVMKTGATEAYDKLPIQFMTTLRCVNDSIIFSDMDMDMAGHQVIDTLDEIPDAIKEGNEDFDLYRLLQEAAKVKSDPRLLKTGNNGWNLDKYKFLHLMLKTWKYRSDAPWYVFIEADTALIWDNLRTFLDQFDSRKKLYLGSPTYLDIEFAHGGTGYILSQAAMEAAVGKHPEIATTYDEKVHSICCGDYFVGRVLLDEEIRLTRAWPIMNGEKPITIPFSQSHWCQPVMTMHHLTAQEVSQVWTFEKQRKAQGISTPLLFKDLYQQFVKPHLLPHRDDWSNLSSDLTYTPPPSTDPDKSYNGHKWDDLSESERASIESPENCKLTCDNDPLCLQWLHNDNSCQVSRAVKLGGMKPSTGKRWTSGWNLTKIEEMERLLGACEGKVEWKTTRP